MTTPFSPTGAGSMGTSGAQQTARASQHLISYSGRFTEFCNIFVFQSRIHSIFCYYERNGPRGAAVCRFRYPLRRVLGVVTVRRWLHILFCVAGCVCNCSRGALSLPCPVLNAQDLSGLGHGCIDADFANLRTHHVGKGRRVRSWHRLLTKRHVDIIWLPMSS